MPRIIVTIADDLKLYDDDGAPTTAFDKVQAALEFAEIPAHIEEQKS